MKGRGYLLSGGLLGIIIGWGLGYLRIPYVAHHHSFWVGSIVAMCLVFAFTLFRNTFQAKGTDKKKARIWLAASLFISAILLLGIILFRQTFQDLEKEVDQKRALSGQLSSLTNAQQQANLGKGLESLLRKIETELTVSSDRRLSLESIEHISRYSHAFEPYIVFTEEDRFLNLAISPERGQLLLALISLDLHEDSFREIRQKASFAGADLEGVTLSGLDLRGIDLGGAMLKDSKLMGMDLSGANLGGALLWGAKIDNTQLVGSDLKRVDANWAQFYRTDLQGAVLDGADFSHTTLREVVFTDVSFQFGKMETATVLQSQVSCTNFEMSQLNRTNFTNSDLSMTNLKRASIEQAAFVHTDLEGIALGEENWLTQLSSRRVMGASALQQIYEVVPDTLKTYTNSKFLLAHRMQ